VLLFVLISVIISYKVSDICDDEGDTAQQKCQRFLPPVSDDVRHGMTYC